MSSQSLISYMKHPALHPKTLLGIALKREQGQLIMNQILPERTVPHKEFTYHEYGDIGGLAHEVQEGDSTPLRSITYKEITTRCVELREGALITEQSQKWLNRDVIRDEMEDLTDVIALKQETMGFEALLDESKYDTSQVIPLDAGSIWGDAENRPQDSMADAKTVIRNIGHVKADTMIISSTDEPLLVKSIPLTQWSFAGPFSQQPIVEGSIGRIMGLDIFVSDAFKESSKPNGDLEPMLDNVAIILKRGNNLVGTTSDLPLWLNLSPLDASQSLIVELCNCRYSRRSDQSLREEPMSRS